MSGRRKPPTSADRKRAADEVLAKVRALARKKKTKPLTPCERVASAMELIAVQLERLNDLKTHLKRAAAALEEHRESADT